MDDLTPFQALALTIEMWEWLKDNPGKGKVDWPGYYKEGICNMESECPLCEFRQCHIRKLDLYTSDYNCGNFCAIGSIGICDCLYHRWQYSNDEKNGIIIYNKILECIGNMLVYGHKGEL